MRVRSEADEQEPAPPKLLTNGDLPASMRWRVEEDVLDGLERLHSVVMKADLAAVVELARDSRNLPRLPKIREVLRILGELNSALAKTGAH